MAGHSDSPRLISDSGRVQISAANTGQTLVDARPAQIDNEAILRLRARAGLAGEQLDQQGEEFGRELRAELNALAGGTAPPSVQAMADLCVSSLTLHKLAKLLAFSNLKKISEAEVEADVQRYVEYTEKGARTAAGLAVQAKDQLIATRQMAIESRARTAVPALSIFDAPDEPKEET